MRQILCFLSFITVNMLFSQVPNIEWSRCYGGPGSYGSGMDFANSIQQTQDGGYIVSGLTTSTNGDIASGQQPRGCWVVKLDSLGNIVWEKVLGGDYGDQANAVRQTIDGGYIVIGSTDNGNASWANYDKSVFIVKLDSLGNVVWERTYGGIAAYNSDEGFDIKQTADGNYIAVGHTDTYDIHGASDLWVLRLDGAGNIIWQKMYGGSANDCAQSVQLTSDGGFILAGYTASANGDVIGAHGSYDFWVLKLDSIGNLIWQKTLGGTDNEMANSIQQTADGYIVAGYTRSNNNGDVFGYHNGVTGPEQTSDFWIVKLDESGNIVWQKCLGGTYNDTANSICLTSDGGYLVTGAESSHNGDITPHAGTSNVPDMWIIKLDNAGNIQWQNTLGGTSHDIGMSLQETQDGGFVVAGFTESSNSGGQGYHGSYDFWVVKFAPQNTMGASGFEQNNIAVYPNPVSSILSVGLFNVKSITLVNAEGKILETLQNARQIDISNYPKGTYLVVIEQESGAKYTKKVIKE